MMDEYSQDLRGFIDFIKENAPREYLQIQDSLSGDWQLAALNDALVKKMRMPVIEFEQVQGTDMPVIQNACASLKRIAKSQGWSVVQLEEKLAHAYTNLIKPEAVSNGAVRENIYHAEDVDLSILPAIRYTETEINPYLSAAHIVALDPVSGALNISFHRLMLSGKNQLALYMTPGGHLDQIYQHNAKHDQDTAIAAFIGAHPLWSLGALAAGSLALDEYAVIGGLCNCALPVVHGLHDAQLLIPAQAEIALEGVLSRSAMTKEGPYGEAFGFVSDIKDRPVFDVHSLSHRTNPIFQDIVPGQLEHLTMTGTAVQVHLQKTLIEQFDCVKSVFLPTPMTVYLTVDKLIAQSSSHDILKTILLEQRFVKHVVLFDDSVEISNAKQTQNALSMWVQADRDVLILPGLQANELDPSEADGKTTKWGVDASSFAKHVTAPVKNRIPEDAIAADELKRIIDRAMGKA